MPSTTRRRVPKTQARFPESGKTPTLGQMIRGSQRDQRIIRRASQDALRAWFRQSERLNIARHEFHLRGPRFVDFARRIGVDQSSAYALVHLLGYREQIIRKCIDDAAAAAKQGHAYRYPGWETAMSWFYKKNFSRIKRSGLYWLTPPNLYRKLDTEFHFDFDPCPHPLPIGWNALRMDWGQSNYVNPPFRKDDGLEGKGVTAFVRKAIAEAEKGKTSVIIMPVLDYITVLLQAGAELRPLGRVPFRDVDDGHAAPSPANVAMFILRGRKS
jgi:hypothetical protein